MRKRFLVAGVAFVGLGVSVPAIARGTSTPNRANKPANIIQIAGSASAITVDGGSPVTFSFVVSSTREVEVDIDPAGPAGVPVTNDGREITDSNSGSSVRCTQDDRPVGPSDGDFCENVTLRPGHPIVYTVRAVTGISAGTVDSQICVQVDSGSERALCSSLIGVRVFGWQELRQKSPGRQMGSSPLA